MKTLITKPQADFSGEMSEKTTVTDLPYLRQNLPQDKTIKTNKSLFTLLLQLLIINCSLLIATANATIRYVSPHGSNEPPYTSWATSAHSIQSCIDISSSGDTIYVGNGVYEERVTMIPGLSLIGAGTDSCVIDSRSLPPLYTIKLTDSCYLAGFQILSENSNLSTGVWVYDVNIQITNVVVKHNYIRFAGNGIRISTSSLGFDNGTKIITQNIIKDVQNGIFSEQTAPIITENLIAPRENGLRSALLSRPTYLNNIIVTIDAAHRPKGYKNGQGYGGILKNNLFLGGGWYGMDTFSADIITNNVIYSNDRKWESGISGSPGYVINNHIENSIIGFWLVGGYPAPQQFQYNNLWNNITNYQNYSPDTTNLSLDPMFVNPDSMDFKLQMYSPLIDAGDPDILDVDGSRSDIGLFGGPYGQKYTYQDLAPKPPGNVNAVIDSGFVKLTWDRNTEADFSHYHIFRDTVPNFMYDSRKIIAALSDTVFFDNPPQKYISGNYYYKLTALDFTRNQSAPSEEVHVNITGIPEAPPLVVEHYKLLHNYPNPFNSSTIIPYRLKAPGYVKLYVYDIKGELLKVLVNQYQNAGYYEVMFSPTREERRRGEFDKGNGWWTGYNNDIATGIYLYKIMVRGEGDIPVFSDMGKMILLK